MKHRTPGAIPRLAAGLVAGLFLVSGLIGTAAAVPDAAPVRSAVTAGDYWCHMPYITHKPATNKKTGYNVYTSRGRIMLRHGYVTMPGCTTRWASTWAAVTDGPGSMYIVLEIDYEGDRVANRRFYEKISESAWTMKVAHWGIYAGSYMRACVAKDPTQTCSSSYATSWWTTP
ncbi:hypothetical protein SAMN04515669_1894 [Jiangella sp. DSM 45060]|nr:hypothetical protein SAMN04515669_1894 [Jiangella sp. DSM 45060]